jgi:phosphatidate cytidylyltransferase
LLVTRILSAVVLAPLVLLAIYLGGLWFAALMVAAGGLMGWEWARMCSGGRFGPPGAMAAATLAVLAPLFIFAPPATAPAVLGVGAATGAVLAASGGSRGDAWLPLGIVYIGLACLALLWLRAVPAEGRNMVFWLLAVVWATDSGAYFAGRAIGGPRLAPRISPNKTWAGLIGGALSAALVGVLAAGLLGRDATLLVVGGMVLAVVAQGGDLLESWCKRRFGVKDSSHIIPGHGGILDRVDGLLAVLLVAFLYFWAVKDPF